MRLTSEEGPCMLIYNIDKLIRVSVADHHPSQFLEYISKMGPVTHDSGPKCRAYAWFRSAEDNDTVPHHWLRRLEV